MNKEMEVVVQHDNDIIIHRFLLAGHYWRWSLFPKLLSICRKDGRVIASFPAHRVIYVKDVC